MVILLAGLLYANAISNSFVYDDAGIILANPYIKDIQHLPQIFTTSLFSFMGAATNYYRPMMTLWFLLCFKLFGLTPSGFHLASLLLHLAVVWILLLLTREMFGDRKLAILVATVFALHPVHTEAVAWIASVNELQVTFFYLLTFWLFMRVARPSGQRSKAVYLAMTGSFLLALLSKEQALTLPLLATVYEHGYREDRAQTTRGQKFARYCVLWLLVIVYLLLRMRFLGGFAPRSIFPDLTHYQAVLSGLALVGQYIGKLLWPVHLNVYYVFHKSSSWSDARVLCGMGAVIAAAVLFVFFWKRQRMVSFALLWLFATLAPVLNPQWLGASVFAERYLYLPSVGFCWIASWGLICLWAWAAKGGMVRRRAWVGGLSIVVALCALRIVTRNRDWRNNIALYTRTLASAPDAHLIRINLGQAYERQGRWPEAKGEYRKVLEYDANDANYIQSLNYLAALSLQQGRYVEAMEYSLRAVHVSPMDSAAHANLGMVYARLGLYDPAESELRLAVSLAPKAPVGYIGLGFLYWAKGDRKLAETTLKQALSLASYDRDAHLVLAKFYDQTGQPAEATREYRTVLKTDPNNPEAILALERLSSETIGVESSEGGKASEGRMR